MKKLFSIMSNLQTPYHFQLNFEKVDQYTGGKVFIHGTKHGKDNQFPSLELPQGSRGYFFIEGPWPPPFEFPRAPSKIWRVPPLKYITNSPIVGGPLVPPPPHDIKESEGDMFNPIFKENVQGQKHPGRCITAEPK